MDQDLIRIHLIKILSLGMKLSAIAERTKINAIDLSTNHESLSQPIMKIGY